MIIYFTDDDTRDAQLIRQLANTRTLSAIYTVRTDSDIRRALVGAIADHCQLVMGGKYTHAMRRLALAMELCGLEIMPARDYLHTCTTGARAPLTPEDNASVRATHDAPELSGQLR